MAGIVRQKFEHVVGHGAFAFQCLALQNGDFRFEVGRLNIRDESALEAGAEPLFQRGDFLGRSVGRKDDLLVLGGKFVEGMGKNSSCTPGFFARN